MGNKQNGFLFFAAMVILLSLAAVWAGIWAYNERQKLPQGEEPLPSAEESAAPMMPAGSQETAASALPAVTLPPQ